MNTQKRNFVTVLTIATVLVVALWAYGPTDSTPTDSTPVNGDAAPNECDNNPTGPTGPTGCPRTIVWAPQLPGDTPTFLHFGGLARCAHIDPDMTWCTPTAPAPDPAPGPDPIADPIADPIVDPIVDPTPDPDQPPSFTG